MGEGATPIVEEDAGVTLKLDFLMPTLSFKDRGSVVLVSKALELGVQRLVADSSGNAGTSIAAYGARAGIAVEVFVPKSTSAKKLAQLHAYGAAVRQVDGPRAAAAHAAMERVESTGCFYASHVFNPLFHHGTKTFAYEVFEQSGGHLPDAILIPAGNGTLLIGTALGFADLVAAGLIGRSPRLVAVQAQRCAPLAVAMGNQPSWGDAGETVAEGIAIPEPPRLGQMIEVVVASGGTVRTASEGGISAARARLAARGIDVEPTAAAAYAAWLEWPEEDRPSSALIPLTGAGLKSSLASV